MTRAARTVAKEIADTLATGLKWRRVKSLDPGGVAYWREIPQQTLERWLLLLAPPKRKVRPRDPARSARRATVKELDALCREVVFLRDGGKCRKCGKSSGLMDWAHVYSRRFRVTRWAPTGSLVLCRGCHLWWHQSPTEAVDWWKRDVGAMTAHRLELMKRAAKCGPLELIKKSLEQEKAKLA